MSSNNTNKVPKQQHQQHRSAQSHLPPPSQHLQKKQQQLQKPTNPPKCLLNQNVTNSHSNSRTSFQQAVRHSGQHDQRQLAQNNNSRLTYPPIDDFEPESLDMAFDLNDFNLPNEALNEVNGPNFEHHGDRLSNLGQNQQHDQFGAIRSQCQGQGEQSQNQSQILQQNLSGFGIFPGDEVSAILEPQSSPLALQLEGHLHQQQFFQQPQQPRNIGGDPYHAHSQLHHLPQQQVAPLAAQQQQADSTSHWPGPPGASRTNESKGGEQLLAESQALKRVLAQLSQEIVHSNQYQHQSQLQGMLQTALQHANSLHETLSQETRTRKDWKFTFKEKVRVKLSEFKEQKKKELRRAEELKFKQQINEFELKDRVSILEQANRRHEEEINKQANANEILKYEKMRLIREHGKRLKQIESALCRIQIQKQGTLLEQRPGYSAAAGPVNNDQAQLRHRRNTVVELDQSSQEALRQVRRPPPDSQNDRKRRNDDAVSRSIYSNMQQDQINVSQNAKNLSQHDHNSSEALALKKPHFSQDSSGAGFGTQLLNLKELVQEFKHQSEQQQEEEVKTNDYQGPAEDDSEAGKRCGKQPSLTDLNFHPQQKLMQNYFSGSQNKGDNSKADEDANDEVNRAVIMPGGVTNTEEDRETAVGDLAQQLSNTSFCPGGNPNDITLPNNLNFFHNRKEDELYLPNSLDDDEELANMSLVDEELLLNTSAALDTRRRRQKRANQNAIFDSDDKAVAELFKDTSSDSVTDQLESLKRQLDTGEKGKGQKNKDVNLDDLIAASVDTDLQKNNENISKKAAPQKKNLFDQKLPFSKDEASDFSQAQIFDDIKDSGNLMLDNRSKLPQQHDANLSLALEDLSAIVSESGIDNKPPNAGDIQVVIVPEEYASDDDNNLARLNRQLMPHFVVYVGDRQIKMPRLDIERVLGLFQEKPFEGNLPAHTGDDSLQTDTILETHKGMEPGGQQTQTSGGSFLNETGSKQVESQKSKLQQHKSESVIDYLNKCDEAISAIIDDAALDADIELPNAACIIEASTMKHQQEVEQTPNPPVKENMLDSLREEIFKEEQQQQTKTAVQDRVAPPSPAPNSMPFELRDSIPSKFTDSNNQMLQQSVMCYANDKHSLSQAGQKIRQSSNSSAEGGHNRFNYQDQSAQTQLRLMKKNDLTLSQKDFGKKSQMRLSELDSASGGGCQRKENTGGEHSEETIVTRNKKIGKIPAVRNIKANGGHGSSIQARGRGSSENQAFLDNQNYHHQYYQEQNFGKIANSDKDKAMSPHTMMTNGTDSIGGSLKTHSLQGEKSRMSAPVTIPAKAALPVMAKESSCTEVVKEVEDDDSKILSVNNSSNQLNEVKGEQSIEMMAYNSAYPHSTKNTRYAKTNVKVSKQGNTSQATDTSSSNQKQQQNHPVPKKTKVSIQRVQHHAEMSSLIRNQQKSSSSIQRLKVVKKASVNSVAPGTSSDANSASAQQNKRDVLTSNSVERPSVCGNSSISLIEQSRISKVNVSAINKDYSSVDESRNKLPQYHHQNPQQETSNPRLSINTRKSKPITVSFKNIVKAGIQKRKTSNTITNGEENGQEDSEKRNSVVTDKNRKSEQIRAQLSGAKKINLGQKPGVEVGKSLNITVLRNNSNSKSKAAAAAAAAAAAKQDNSNQDKANVVKHVLKISNPNSSVEETRDGSVIFIGNRKNTVERVKSKRESSVNDSEVTDVKTRIQQPKQKTKMLIAAHQIKQRKLSIGSAHAAASINPQQALYDGGKRANCLVAGSRVHTETSKVNSPDSPRRKSSKSIGIKIQNQNGVTRETKPSKSAFKKCNIISLKRRDAAAPTTEFSQNMSSSKEGDGTKDVIKVQNERNTSVGTEGHQISKRSQQITDAPKLNIKRMTKQKNGRAKSTRPNTVIKQDSSQLLLNMVNQTAIVGATNDQNTIGHESFLCELQTNQNNTVFGDMSLLSKIGGAESKSHLLAAHYGTTSAGQNGSILINQSSQQNLQQHVSHEALGVKCAGKRIGLSRASIETSSSHQQQQHSQVNTGQVLTFKCPSRFTRIQDNQ